MIDRRKESAAKLAYSIAEVARMLSLSEISIRRKIKAGELPSIRIGKRVLIRWVDIQRLLQLDQEEEPVTLENLRNDLRKLHWGTT